MNPADIPHHALVGLDIGGTKTHGVRWLNGQVIAEAKSGSANTQNVSLDTARENLAKVFESLGSEAIDMVIAGAGGIDTQQDAERLRDLIASHAPTAQINVVHDSRLILAAGHAATGMAVILGTGSAFGESTTRARKPDPVGGVISWGMRPAAIGWAGKRCGSPCAKQTASNPVTTFAASPRS